jgi:2-polyprenyl-3-methyl-5-hydroxy-6-metoxy-1,4-benzoquinol methylase
MIGNNQRIKHLQRQCPVCDNIEGEILHNQRFHMPENHILPSEYDVVYCKNCGFVFADTIADQNTYNIFYQDMSKYEDVNTASGGGDKTYDSLRLIETAADLQKLIPSKDSSIIDIGCGNGGLLLELKKLGYTNLSGLDPSPVCVKNIQDKGIEAHLGGIINGESSLSKKYDVVIFSHVFEHLVDLKTAVHNIYNLLTTNGLVYVETPDASRYHEFYVVPFYYFDTEHINHFCSVSLINLFANQGFDFVYTQQKTFKVSETFDYPAVFCCFKKNEAKISSGVTNTELVKNSVSNYVLRSNKEGSLPEVENLAKSKTPVIVFGAGNFTLRLLETTVLGNCNVIAFIDNDSKKHGNIIKGVRVYSKDFLLTNDAIIIICSSLFSLEIEEEIRSMKIKNKVIKINE